MRGWNGEYVIGQAVDDEMGQLSTPFFFSPSSSLPGTDGAHGTHGTHGKIWWDEKGKAREQDKGKGKSQPFRPGQGAERTQVQKERLWADALVGLASLHLVPHRRRRGRWRKCDWWMGGKPRPSFLQDQGKGRRRIFYADGLRKKQTQLWNIKSRKVLVGCSRRQPCSTRQGVGHRAGFGQG
jgi:hypothetical protein